MGGYFRSVSGTRAYSIASWDGEGWHPLGRGVGTGHCWDYHYVFDLLPYGSDLIAAGNFWLAGGQHMRRIARWDGATWSPLGGGFDDACFALCPQGSGFWAGGDFMQAGDKSSWHIARWVERSSDVQGPPPSQRLIVQIPNPYQPSQMIRLALPAGETVAIDLRLDIFDVNGRRIRDLLVTTSLPKAVTLSWDGRSDAGERVRTGIYWLRARLGPTHHCRPLALIR